MAVRFINTLGFYDHPLYGYCEYNGQLCYFDCNEGLAAWSVANLGDKVDDKCNMEPLYPDMRRIWKWEELPWISGQSPTTTVHEEASTLSDEDSCIWCQRGYQNRLPEPSVVTNEKLRDSAMEHVHSCLYDSVQVPEADVPTVFDDRIWQVILEDGREYYNDETLRKHSFVTRMWKDEFGDAALSLSQVRRIRTLVVEFDKEDDGVWTHSLPEMCRYDIYAMYPAQVENALDYLATVSTKYGGGWHSEEASAKYYDSDDAKRRRENHNGVPVKPLNSRTPYLLASVKWSEIQDYFRSSTSARDKVKPVNE